MKQVGDGSETNTDYLVQSDEFGPWPLNVVGRQWRNAKRLHGWLRLSVVLALGAEVLLIIAAIVALLLI